jgi:hypothetical protein
MVGPVPPVGSSHSPSIDGCNRASRTAAHSDALVVHKPGEKIYPRTVPKMAPVPVAGGTGAIFEEALLT